MNKERIYGTRQIVKTCRHSGNWLLLKVCKCSVVQDADKIKSDKKDK